MESWLDSNLYRIRRTFGWIGPASIHPYRELGTQRELSVHGRVLAGAQTREAHPDDSWGRNAAAVIRALASDEIPDAAIRARFGSDAVETVTNDEGYFHASVTSDGLAGWRDVEIELVDTPSVRATAQVLVPPEDAQFGVISDFDDTIIVTDVPRPLRMITLMLFRNAFSRQAFEGTAELYRALAAGSDGTGSNPLFYVSSSSWNFYPMLEQFLEHNGFPAGPILLRDIGLEKDHFLAEGNEHKLGKLERILKTYPKLLFLLIGDSGQDDPYLYAETMRRHPGRIRAIYIRDVSSKKRAAVAALAAQVNDQGSVMRLFSSAAEAAEWAREAGWIA
ncbi:MAG: phosphatase domain-containing protein [Bryobacterales bacterium]